MQDPIQAEVWYKKAIAAEVKEPKAFLYLADAIRRQGKYDEAVVEYKKFIEKANPEDKVLGEKGLEVEKRVLTVDNPIKAVGTYTVKAKLFAGVDLREETHLTFTANHLKLV